MAEQMEHADDILRTLDGGQLLVVQAVGQPLPRPRGLSSYGKSLASLGSLDNLPGHGRMGARACAAQEAFAH